VLSDLERTLQYADGEASNGFGGEPEAEVGMSLAEFLQMFLQLLQPVHEQMTVLQHQPLTAVDCCVQQLNRQLKKQNSYPDMII